MTMDALVFYGQGDIRFEKRPAPQIGMNEILVKVKAAGVLWNRYSNFSRHKAYRRPSDYRT